MSCHFNFMSSMYLRSQFIFKTSFVENVSGGHEELGGHKDLSTFCSDELKTFVVWET